MHRAGKRSLRLTAAWNQHKALKKSPTAHVACPCWDSIPAGHSEWRVFDTVGLYGTQARITLVWVQSHDGNWMCGNARNSPPYGDNLWAGLFFCSNNTTWQATHEYGNYPRSGWGAPATARSQP